MKRVSLTAVVRNGLRDYRDEWRLIIPVAVLIVIPVALLQAAAARVSDAELSGGTLAHLVGAVIWIAIAGIGYFFLKGVLAHLVVARRNGAPRPSLRRVFGSLPYLEMIAADMILVIGIGVGTELLIVPGLVIGTYFALAPIVIETEHRGLRRAFRRSRELVAGSFFTVAAILIAMLAWVAVGSLLFKELIAALAPEGSSKFVIEALGFLLAGVLVKPVAALIEVELTLDLAESRPPAKTAPTPAQADTLRP